jgi:spore germination protein GerM
MAPVKHKRSTINLLIPFMVVALVFGVLLWNKHRASTVTNPKPDLQQENGTRTAVLFFVGDGNRLSREARELEPCSDTPACVKEVLDELFSGPVGDLDEAIPEGALLNGVRVEGASAVVDVNRNFVDELPRGSTPERMAVYSIVNTICVNFPQITHVKLTVEGDGKTVLPHLDLSAPLAADYSMESQSAPSPAGTVSKPSTTGTKKGTP